MKTKLAFIVYNKLIVIGIKEVCNKGEGSSLLVENNFSINSQRES